MMSLRQFIHLIIADKGTFDRAGNLCLFQPPAKVGPLAAGESRTLTFLAPRGGTYLYFDPLNEPVNRVMGLYGAP